MTYNKQPLTQYNYLICFSKDPWIMRRWRIIPCQSLTRRRDGHFMDMANSIVTRISRSPCIPEGTEVRPARLPWSRRWRRILPGVMSLGTRLPPPPPWKTAAPQKSLVANQTIRITNATNVWIWSLITENLESIGWLKSNSKN